MQRSRSGMSFSTISAGRLGSRASSLERKIIRTGFRYVQSLLPGSFHFFSDAPLAPLLPICCPNAVQHTTACSVDASAAWLASMYRRLQVTPSLTLNLVFLAHFIRKHHNFDGGLGNSRRLRVLVRPTRTTSRLASASPSILPDRTFGHPRRIRKLLRELTSLTTLAGEGCRRQEHRLHVTFIPVDDT